MVIFVINFPNIRYSNYRVAQFHTYLSKTLFIDANNVFIICDFIQNKLVRKIVISVT